LQSFRQGPKFAFQHLIYPMIDDRTAVRKDLHPYVGEFVWTQENNHFGRRSLLGAEPGSADVSPYAAAARAADVSGLPPTYISVGGLDLFLEENITYADRLSRAGVPVELHMYPRAYHGFYRATNARVTKAGRARQSRGAATFPARIGPLHRFLPAPDDDHLHAFCIHSGGSARSKDAGGFVVGDDAEYAFA
jgi:acetyl esterase/lipase